MNWERRTSIARKAAASCTWGGSPVFIEQRLLIQSFCVVVRKVGSGLRENGKGARSPKASRVPGGTVDFESMVKIGRGEILAGSPRCARTGRRRIGLRTKNARLLRGALWEW